MITPKFRLEQTELQVQIFIEAPYVNVKDSEIHILDNDFRFYSAPYYLRLNLPGNILENDNSVAKYEVDTQTFTVIVDKETPGQVFPNLDMLTILLQPSSSSATRVTQRPLIEVLSSTNNDNEPSNSTEEESMDGDEWFIQQKFEDVSLANKYYYGFACLHSGLGTKFEDELNEVALIKNPDAMSPKSRREAREIDEKTKFSDEHYLADLFFTEEIPSILRMVLDTKKFDALDKFAKEQLIELKHREFLLDKMTKKECYLSMVDILFAYLYDYRIMKGSHSVESPWNFSRVSATLSWFEEFQSIHEVVKSCIRRSLSYPLYRNWDLTTEVFKDVLKILEIGNVGILNCFLKMLSIFKKRAPYYLLNQLYIEDYCIWIQQASDYNIKTLIPALSQAVGSFGKKDVGLDLVELEAAGVSEQEEMELATERDTQLSEEVSKMRL